MIALALLADLRSRGVEVAAAGDRIRFRPIDRVTTADRAALRSHKAELLALLAGESTTRRGWSRITLSWPATSTVPTVKGHWRCLEDGTIEAEYTRDQLRLSLALAGVDVATVEQEGALR